jgi:hypothetical protein
MHRVHLIYWSAAVTLGWIIDSATGAAAQRTWVTMHERES